MAGKNYIATAPLFVGYARAHNPGDVVPDANVEEHDAQGIDYEAPATAPAVPAKP
jgi:hypothetical protein